MKNSKRYEQAKIHTAYNILKKEKGRAMRYIAHVRLPSERDLTSSFAWISSIAFSK